MIILLFILFFYIFDKCKIFIHKLYLSIILHLLLLHSCYNYYEIEMFAD